MGVSAYRRIGVCEFGVQSSGFGVEVWDLEFGGRLGVWASGGIGVWEILTPEF
jgi:hypothetical protein